MWSICHSKVKENIAGLFDELQNQYDFDGDEISDIADGLTALVNMKETLIDVDTPSFRGDARINAFFSLNYTNIKQLSNVTRDGLTITGTYTIPLGIMLYLFSKHAAGRGQNMDEAINKCIPPEWKTKPVYQEQVVVFFGENGVLDKVTDVHNVPFSNGEDMLGFRHICPHCGRELSRAVGCAEEIVVALAGSPRAGKSSCMVAMVNSLLEDKCPGVRVVPIPQDRKWSALNSEVEHYRQCAKITKTPDNQTEVPSHSILIQMKDPAKTKRVLTIVDMPGELWQAGNGLTSDFFAQYAGIYENIDCIWFVISKATIRMSQVGEIPDEIKQDLILKTSEDVDVIKKANPANLMTNLNMIKSQLAARLGKPMPPTVVIVSKPDHFVSEIDKEKTHQFRLFPADTMDIAGYNAGDIVRVLRSDSDRLYGLNQMPICAHANDVRSFIEDINPAFLSAVEDNCQDRFYVALSPYGRPAVERGVMAGAPTPYHELYPFVWTLAIMGGVKVYQNCCWLKRGFLGKIVDQEDTREAITFHYAQRNLPEGPGKQNQQVKDHNIVYGAISNNLLMNGRKYLDRIEIPHVKQ